jgi:hypothetical protein
VGKTHGRMKEEQATQKGLNMNIRKIEPLKGSDSNFISLPPVLPVVIQILSLRDN